MTDRELLQQIFATLGDVDQKLRIARNRVSDEHLNSGSSDVAGLIIMIRGHLGSDEPSKTE